MEKIEEETTLFVADISKLAAEYKLSRMQIVWCMIHIVQQMYLDGVKVDVPPVEESKNLPDAPLSDESLLRMGVT